MSRDDGVYVLKTKDQYRVINTQAIEEVWEDYYEERLNPLRVVVFWRLSKYTRNFETAMKIATSIEKRERTEYGIKVFTYNKTWKHIVEDAKKKAIEELDKHKDTTDSFYQYWNKIYQQILNM